MRFVAKRLLLLSVLLTAPVFAAPSVSIAQQGPVYIGQVIALVNGRQIALERQEGRIGGHFGLNPFGSLLVMKLDGPRSMVRLPGGAQLTFLARVGADDVDPSSLFSLCKIIIIKGDHREMRGKKDECGVPLQMNPYGKNFIKMQTNYLLPPGEYGIQSLPTFQNPSGGALYLFGVN